MHNETQSEPVKGGEYPQYDRARINLKKARKTSRSGRLAKAKSNNGVGVPCQGGYQQAS